jgi:hypothetical protein
MKTEDKKFAFLVWIEVFSILVFSNFEATKPFIKYMILIFLITSIYGYSRKNFIAYYMMENKYLKIILFIGGLFFIIALLILIALVVVHPGVV